MQEGQIQVKATLVYWHADVSKRLQRNPVVFAAMAGFNCQTQGNGAIHPTVNDQVCILR